MTRFEISGAGSQGHLSGDATVDRPQVVVLLDKNDVEELLLIYRLRRDTTPCDPENIHKTT